MESLDSLISRSFVEDAAPGVAFCLVSNGDVVYERCVGLGDIRTGGVITPDSNFRLASMTKHMTALAALMLSDWGKLDLDSPLTNYLEGLPAFGAAMTPRMLIHHTSGLVDYESLLKCDPYARLEVGQQQVSNSDVLALIRGADHTCFSPGTAFSYSNTGYVLLALLIERVSGLTFPQFLKQHLFEPLGMCNSLAYAQNGVEVPNRVYGHERSEAGWRVADQSVTSATLGDGGVYCSVADMKKWFAFLDGAIALELSEGAYADYFSPGVLSDGSTLTIRPEQLDKDSAALPPRTYGFGWAIGEHRGARLHYHRGRTMGFSGYLFREPERHFYAIVLSNGIVLGAEFIDTFFEAVFAFSTGL